MSPFLPPAYVVRREGNVLTHVCPSICLSTGGGGQSSQGGWVSPAGGVGQSSRGVGQSSRGGVSPAGRGSVQPGGGRVSYSLHGGRYASCVHAGGLSCNVDICVKVHEIETTYEFTFIFLS